MKNRIIMKKLSPEEVQKMLAKEGKEVTLDEAAIILDFLRKVADIVVDSYLENAAKDNSDRDEFWREPEKKQGKRGKK